MSIINRQNPKLDLAEIQGNENQTRSRSSIFLLTPGTDMFPFFSDSANQDVSGRNGNDLMLLYDSALPGGDTQLIHKITGNGQGNSGSLPDEDIFILGDWRRPYYLDASTDTSGHAQFAVITDFSPLLDTIRLHGDASNYFLVQSESDTQIFWGESGGTQDLVATISRNSGLNLNNSYFEFVGDTAPSASNNAIKQVGTIGLDEVSAVAIAPSNGIYVSGYTTGSLAGQNSGSIDGWIARYDSQGQLLWNKQIGTRGWDVAWDLESDLQGNAYVVRRSKSGGSGFTVGVSKYNSSGTELWTTSISGVSASFRIDVEPDGSAFALSGPRIRSPWAWDAGVVKYDGDGNSLWANKVGSRQADESYAVTIDNQDNVLAAGWTTGDLGGTTQGFYDVWLTKFNAAGNLQWSRQFGSSSFEFAWGIDTDNAGNAYVAGHTSGDLAGTLQGPYDGFIAKYDTLGNQQWIKQIGGSGDDQISNIVVGQDNNIYVTGISDGDFGGANIGSLDAFVAKYNPQGTQIWVKKFGGLGADYPKGITINNSVNTLYVSGVTDGSLGELNQGSFDGWIAKLDTNSGNILNFGG